MQKSGVEACDRMFKKERRRVKTIGQIGSVATKLAIGILVICVALTIVVGAMLYQGSTQGKVTDVVIPRGSSVAKVVEILNANHIIENPTFFKIVLRVTGGAGKVRAGEFRFREQMRAIDAMMVLYNDEPIVYHVTIPEGWTVKQIGDLLAAQKLVDPNRFLELTLNRAAAQKFNLPSPTLEGFLFPDTYDFSKIDGEERVVERMVGRFLQVWEKELKLEAEEKKMSMLDLVTFASIVEKETGNPSERNLVASVFHNRLKKKMRLQSDPTTIYGILNFNGNLTKADLLRFSPYNTYVIPALPPGPIASPGLASLQATLRPAKSNYLFFVANKKGSHVFSETYSQHARYVNAYQK
jgi:UPF0755 protein